MTSVLIALLLGLHLSFLWGRISFFRIDGPTSAAVRLIEVSGTLSVAVGIALVVNRHGASVWPDRAALMLVALSALLFAWGVRTVGRHRLTAAFSNDAPLELITSGPFRYLRNPFYASYLLAHAVPVMASRSAWSWLPLVWMAAIYTRAAQSEERKFLASPWAHDYRQYSARAGRFFPRWPVAGGAPPWP